MKWFSTSLEMLCFLNRHAVVESPILEICLAGVAVCFYLCFSLWILNHLDYPNITSLIPILLISVPTLLKVRQAFSLNLRVFTCKLNPTGKPKALYYALVKELEVNRSLQYNVSVNNRFVIMGVERAKRWL